MRFLFVDRILQLVPEQQVRGIKHITADDFYLCPDEQGRLCFISSLIGETLGQLAAWNVMASNNFTLRPVAGVVSCAKLHRPAYVGETLLLESFIEALDDRAVQYRSVASVNQETVFSIEGALGPLLPMNNFIEDRLIRQQFNEINRPTDWLPETNSTMPNSINLKPNSYFPSLVFDGIISSEPGISISAVKHITRAAPYFPDHFPNNPVLPMTVLLECKLNLAREFIARASFEQHYQVTELRKIKMNEFIHPGDVVKSVAKVKALDNEQLVLSVRSEVNSKRVCVLDIVMIAKGNKL